MIYWQLLWVYLKIGMFGFGGGYAMLSLIQHEIVDLHHLSLIHISSRQKQKEEHCLMQMES